MLPEPSTALAAAGGAVNGTGGSVGNGADGTAVPVVSDTELSAFVPTFRASAPYIQAFRGKTFVVAFGGEVVADDTFPNFIADLNLLASLGIRLVLVHGARPQVEKLLAQRGMESRYHRGIRVTDESQLGSVIGANYNQPLGVTGGTGTTVFSVASGSLPAGLTLSPAGLLAGTITVSGQFNFSVRALDATNCLGERGYTLNVSASCPTNTITPVTLPNATSGTSYNQALTVTGTGAVFSVVGTLPSGLTLSQAGVLAGTPSVFGQFNFSVRALSVNGCLGERAYTLTISPACGTLTINPNPLP